MRSMGATYDEHAHLPAGYTYWRTGDFRFNPQHPPLVKLLAAVPLLFMSPKVDWTDESWAGPRPSQWRFGTRFFYLWGNDLDRLLFWGRLPIVLLATLLGVYVFRWSAERFGPGAGLFALLLYAFCPNVLAHARLVTMDVAVSTFLTIALYYVWRYRRDGTRRALVLCGLHLGLALASKFSALLMAPVIAVAALWPRKVTAPAAAGAAPAPKKKRAKAEKRAPTANGVSLSAVGMVVGVAVLVTWVAYLFPTDPGFYWKGLAAVNADHRPDFFYYLMGSFKQGRWWYYFAAAALFKTPVPVMIATVWAAVLAWRTRAASGTDDLLLVAPAAIFFVITSAMADNLGIRYILPVYPLLFVFAGRLGEALRPRPAGRAALALIAAWQIAGAVRIYPDYIAYFNEPSGGPPIGYRLLDDSNVDWGQDLKRLAPVLQRESTRPLHLCYDLRGHPPYYGIDAQRVTVEQLVGPPAPGFYAIATHCLVRLQTLNRPGQPEVDWLKRYEPVGRVGYSFYLFRF
jgi:4-amino-4-deoxy-L-arabinose transferase-like glycosyltransferase